MEILVFAFCFWGVMCARAYQRHKNAKKIASFIVLTEEARLGCPTNPNDVGMSLSAKYRGTYPNLPFECNAVICLIGQSLYVVKDETNFLRIGLSSISNLDWNSPMDNYLVFGTPVYQMAAEVQKQSMGLNVEITFWDETGAEQKLRLKEVPTKTAQELIAKLHVAMDIPVTAHSL